MSPFFAIEKISGKVHDLLKDYHMFTVAQAIDSYDKINMINVCIQISRGIIVMNKL
jgi:hypothetical protein